MKRFLSLLLVLALVLCLAACGGPAAEESKAPQGGGVGQQGTDVSTGTEETKDFQFPADLPAKKVGAIGIYTGNELYIQWKENLSSLGEKFNVEFQFVEVTNAEDYAGAVENLCTAGVNGIIMQGCTEAILQVTDKYNFPFVSYGTTFTDEEIAVFASYKTFMGVVTEDDNVSARNAADAMYEAGCRKVGMVGLTRGLAKIMDDRADSFIARFTELGGEIVAEDYSMMGFADSISNFAAAYPEMDGIFSVILNESVFQAFTTEGLAGSVKLAGFDMSDSCDAFFESGDLVFTCTGQQATIVTAFAPLYNYMYDGTYLVPDRSKMVTRNFVDIHNAEEAALYNEYVRFSTCYSPEEIGYMIKGFNPDYTFEQYQAMHMAFSIEDVMTRSGAK